MFRHARIALVAIGLIALWLSPTRAEEQPSHVDLLIGRDGRTARVRFHVTLDGKDLVAEHERAAQAWVERLFEQLDHDQSGGLDAVEAKSIPIPATSILDVVPGINPDEVHVAVNVPAIDDDDDDIVSKQELKDFLDGFSASAFRPRRLAPTRRSVPSSHAELWKRLDANQDGKLSVDELAAAGSVMAADADRNGTVLIQELDETLADVANNQVPQPSPFKRVTADEPPELSLQVAFTNPPRQCAVTASVAESPRNRIDASGEPANRTSAKIDFVSIGVRSLPGRFRVLDEARDSLAHDFESADADRDGTVSCRDRLSDALQRMFAQIDADGSSSLTREELAAFGDDSLGLRSALELSQSTIWISDEGRGLFDFADSNRDSALSAGELRDLAGQAAALDRNGDGEIAAGEIPSRYEIVIQQGTLPSLEGRSRPFDAGPRWFFRTDRNLDGELSREEFLGDATAFDRIDANHNGSIELDEAIAGEG